MSLLSLESEMITNQQVKLVSATVTGPASYLKLIKRAEMQIKIEGKKI